MVMFLFVNFWTISIHDGAEVYDGTILNGAAHHTIHHTKFNFNYGQYFTFWDRIMGTHKLFDDSSKYEVDDPSEQKKIK